MQNIKRLLCVCAALLLAVPAWAAESVPEGVFPEEELLPEEETFPDREVPAPFEDWPPAPAEEAIAPEDEVPAPAEDAAVPVDNAPVIQVTVPTSGKIGLNPYHMDIPTSQGTSTDEIVHEPQIVINGGDFPVRVSARAVGRLEPESTARFVSAPPAPDAEDKQIFMYVEFQNDPMLWSGSFTGWPNQLLVTDWGEEKTDVMALDAYGVGYFRLFGSLTDSPFEMWGAVDAPDVTLAFTFSTWEDATPPAEELEEEPGEEPKEEEPAEEQEPMEEPIETPEDAPVEEPIGEPIEAPDVGEVQIPETSVPTENVPEVDSEKEPPEEPAAPEGTEENNGW